MSTTNDNKRQQLISKLREMFQMDQADRNNLHRPAGVMQDMAAPQRKSA